MKKCLILFLLFSTVTVGITDDKKTKRIDKPVIVLVRIERENVFDRLLMKRYSQTLEMINNLHCVTKEDVIADELDFKTGDELDYIRLRESESHLRRLQIFSEVNIDTVTISPGKVEVIVHTVDRWTSFVPLFFKYSPGRLDISTGFQELNLTGRMYSLSVSYNNINNVQFGSIDFRNPRVGGTRMDLRAGLGLNETMKLSWASQIQRAFIFPDDKFSWGIKLSELHCPEYSYEQGLTERQWDRSTLHTYGYLAERLGGDFIVGTGFDAGKSEWDSDDLDAEFSFVVPLVSADLGRRRYTAIRFVDMLGPFEELGLGWRIDARVGPVLYDLESGNSAHDDFYASLRGRYSYFRLPVYLFVEYMKTGFFSGFFDVGNEITEVGRISGFLETGKKGKLVFRGEAMKIANIAGFSELTLGGLTGIRGYPPHFFNGNDMFDVNIEERVVLTGSRAPVNISATAFLDWGGRLTGERGETGGSLGLGIQVGGLKKTSLSLFRFDLAFPLEHGLPPAVSIGSSYYFSPMGNLEFKWPHIRFTEDSSEE